MREFGQGADGGGQGDAVGRLHAKTVIIDREIFYIGSFFIDILAALRYLTGLLAVPFYLLAGVRLYKLGSAGSPT